MFGKLGWGWSAKCGTTDLTFNPLSGRYSEAEEIEDDYDWDILKKKSMSMM